MGDRMRSKLTSEVKVKFTGRPSAARQDGDKRTTNTEVPNEVRQSPEQASTRFLNGPSKARPPGQTDPSICLATKVREYLEALVTLGEDKDSCLFKGCMKGAHFVKAPMGKNLLHDIGKDVAKELGLQDWTSYTGHCWRRSSATQVAGEGATALDMKRQFGWQQETTAMRYLDGTNQQMIKMAKLATGQSSSSTLPGPSSSASNEKVVGADLKKVTPSVIATLATKPNIVPVMRKSSMNVSDGLRNRGTESGEQKNNDARVYNFTIGDNCTITIN
jgi:hypothetical protein